VLPNAELMHLMLSGKVVFNMSNILGLGSKAIILADGNFLISDFEYRPIFAPTSKKTGVDFGEKKRGTILSIKFFSPERLSL
jgi:hypothetical protein